MSLFIMLMVAGEGQSTLGYRARCKQLCATANDRTVRPIKFCWNGS